MNREEDHLMTVRSAGDHGRCREVFWRVVDGPSARLVVCGLYQVASNGVELRVGYTDHILRSERFTDVTSARGRAEELLKGIRVAGVVNV
jgi:hypothetical protein